MTAIITYRPNAQKTPGLYDRILSEGILRDICIRVTGQNDFRVIRDTSSYNKGRLITIEYEGTKSFVSLSEVIVEARNQSVQSIPTAINLYYADNNPNKKLYYYFMPHNGNYFTDYHLFYFRLLKTAGVIFLNLLDYYPAGINAFESIDELINERNDNKGTNRSNNSSFISKTSDKVQIYAITYGANKYESTLLAIAAAAITDRPIDLYNICEQDLARLPQSSLNTINAIGNISIHDTSITLEKKTFINQARNNDFRSPIYQRNLLQRLGRKHCALCGCEIPEFIQGAHVWGVAEITRNDFFNDDIKFNHAISGENGLWLCQNHHKLFDSHYLSFNIDGRVLIPSNLCTEYGQFIRNIIVNNALDNYIMTDNFKWYLSQRNSIHDYSHYQYLVI